MKLETNVDTISIYGVEANEVIRDCYVLIFNTIPSLCYSMSLDSLYYSINDLACVAKDSQYRWYYGHDITNTVKHWLEMNSYTWPLSRQQRAHFLLTFL